MKAVTIHAALAAASLAWAYQTWTREEEQERPPGEVTIMQCDPEQLTKLEIESKSHLVTGTPLREGKTPRFWFRSQRKPEEADEAEAADSSSSSADAGVAADAAAGSAGDGAIAETPSPRGPHGPHGAHGAHGPHGPHGPHGAQGEDESEQTSTQEARPYDVNAPVEFLSNERFEEVRASLAPLRAVRAVGEVPKERLAEFGFDDVDMWLRVHCGDQQQIELEIGGRTYGSGDRYARRPAGSEVFLLEGKAVVDLLSARYKFMQADLHAFELKEVDAARVKALGQERKLAHRARKSETEARWVDAAQPDRRNEAFQTWFQRVARLRAKGYLPRDAEPGSDLEIPAGEPEEVLTIEYSVEGKPSGKLEMVRVDAGGKGYFYGRTEATRTWVVLYDSMAKQVAEDLPLVVGADAEAGQSISEPDDDESASGAQDAPAPSQP